MAMKRLKLVGSRGLIAAVIDQARVDYLSGNEALKKDTLTYFGSALYQHHLEEVGLDRNLLPKELNMEDERLVRQRQEYAGAAERQKQRILNDAGAAERVLMAAIERLAVERELLFQDAVTALAHEQPQLFHSVELIKRRNWAAERQRKKAARQQQATVLNGEVEAYAAEHEVSYLQAFDKLREKQPEIFEGV